MRSRCAADLVGHQHQGLARGAGRGGDHQQALRARVATHGQGSGADWSNRSPATAWATPGAAKTTDFVITPLQSVTGLNPSANSGDAADSADPDSDGLINLLKFATGTLPKTANGPSGSLVKNGSSLEFTYPRSHAAVADGTQFLVEWSATLDNDWSISSVTQSGIPGTDNGTTVLWKATTPAGTDHRFLHLRLTAP